METLTETRKQEARWLQMERAEQARRIHKRIQSRIIELQVLPNGEIMSDVVFRLVLKTNEDMKMRFDILSERKDKICRFIWNNA